MVASAPVTAFVVAVLVYAILRRGQGDLPEDGPGLRGKGLVPAGWFVITAGLTAVIMVYPGLTSLNTVLHEEDQPDILVRVEGVQWTWLVTYPELGVSNVRELRLPADRTVRFEITSRDVLHSFWVPAFLMKVDAVPGLTSTLSLRVKSEGSFDMDPTVRLQCAELCGLSHAQMTIPVEVVSKGEFDRWAEETARKQAAAAAGGPPPTFTLVAQELKFDAKELRVDAGKSVVLLLDNRDAGVLHNFAIYVSESAAKKGEAALFAGPTEPGPIQQRLQFSIDRASTYFFRCDVHPTTMTGKLIAK
jgi:cytochrome c oxidase subunit 2